MSVGFPVWVPPPPHLPPDHHTCSILPPHTCSHVPITCNAVVNLSWLSFLFQIITSVCWANSGRQVACSYSDGNIVVWNMKSEAKPERIFTPHGEHAHSHFLALLTICMYVWICFTLLNCSFC